MATLVLCIVHIHTELFVGIPTNNNMDRDIGCVQYRKCVATLVLCMAYIHTEVFVGIVYIPTNNNMDRDFGCV